MERYTEKQTVIIEQNKPQETPPKLSSIDIYENGKVRREQVTLTQQKEYFLIATKTSVD